MTRNKSALHAKTWGWLAGLLAFFALFLLLARLVPSAPISSDVELYFEIGLKGLKDPFVLNRYFHIYLQRIFILLAGEPLLGMQYFWAFLMAATTLFCVLIGHKLSNNLSIGLLGAALFWAAQWQMDLAGIPLVDFTAMTLATAMVLVYLCSLEAGPGQRFYLVLLGTLVWFGFKSKETTLPVAAVLLLLGWHTERFAFSYWWRRIRWVLIGVLLGVLVFFALNAVFLKDIFFGFRPAEFLRFVDTYVPDQALLYENDPYSNWFTSFVLRLMLLPFLLYILSGVVAYQQKPLAIRIVWLTPIAVLAFLILTINNIYGFNPRFALPSTAILCALSPQFLSLNPSERSGKALKTQQFLPLFSAGLAGLVLVLVILWSRQTGADLVNTYNLLLLPALLCLMLALLFWRKDSLWVNALLTAALLIAVFFPLYRNLKEIIVVKDNHRRFSESVSPLMQFKNSVQTSPRMLYCVATEVFEDKPIAFTKNVDELSSIYNIVIDANTSRKNFLYLSLAELKRSIHNTETECTYILIPTEEKLRFEAVNDSLGLKEGLYTSKPSADGAVLLYTRQ